MNIPQMISELLSERERLDDAILALERIAQMQPRKRGRPPKSVTEMKVAKPYQTVNATSTGPVKARNNGNAAS